MKFVRGMRLMSEATAFRTGSPKRRPIRIGVKITLAASRALSRTGISTIIPRTRSGKRWAVSRVVLAPSEVPPITAFSISRWSSSPTTCWAKKVIE